jgi:hypothetical protein
MSVAGPRRGNATGPCRTRQNAADASPGRATEAATGGALGCGTATLAGALASTEATLAGALASTGATLVAAEEEGAESLPGDWGSLALSPPRHPMAARVDAKADAKSAAGTTRRAPERRWTTTRPTMAGADYCMTQVDAGVPT